jgi:hypothetical protein
MDSLTDNVLKESHCTRECVGTLNRSTLELGFDSAWKRERAESLAFRIGLFRINSEWNELGLILSAQRSSQASPWH